jgi:hypothetical protein
MNLEYKTKFYFKNGLKIAVEKDFLRYYFHLILKSPVETLGLGLPMYGSHISVTLPRIHGEKIVMQSEKYAGQDVSFWYNGDIVKGGQNSWFTNYYMKVDCPRADEIKRELGIVENSLTRLILHYLSFGLLPKPLKFLCYHLTLCNTKHWIVENNPKAKELSQRMNRGEFTVDEFREKMKQL